MAAGRLKEAEKEMKLAKWLDPVSPRACCASAHVLFCGGRFNEAKEECLHALALDPNFAWAFEQLGVIHEETGQYPEGIEALQKARIANGIEPANATRIGEELRGAFSTLGARGYWEKRLELADLGSTLGGDLYDLAVIYLHLDETDAVFECFEKLEAQKSDFAFRINNDRRFNRLRSDPRFVALLRKLHLNE